jgi:hypothetical protein
LGENRAGGQHVGGGSLGQGQARPAAADNRGASAFQGVGSGRDVSAASTRGAQSRQSIGASGGGGARAGGGFSGGGGGARGGGGGGRGRR